MWQQTKNGEEGNRNYRFWKKDGDRVFQWWNHGKTSLVVEVWRQSPNDWRATVNGNYLTKESSKSRAMYYAKEYMRRIQ